MHTNLFSNISTYYFSNRQNEVINLFTPTCKRTALSFRRAIDVHWRSAKRILSTISFRVKAHSKKCIFSQWAIFQYLPFVCEKQTALRRQPPMIFRHLVEPQTDKTGSLIFVHIDTSKPFCVFLTSCQFPDEYLWRKIPDKRPKRHTSLGWLHPVHASLTNYRLFFNHVSKGLKPSYLWPFNTQWSLHLNVHEKKKRNKNVWSFNMRFMK